MWKMSFPLHWNSLSIITAVEIYIHTYVYINTVHTHSYKRMLLSHQKEWNNAICRNNGWISNLEISILSEVSQKKINTVWYHLFIESKIWQKWTYLQNKNRLTENRLVVPRAIKGKEEGWIGRLGLADANY